MREVGDQERFMMKLYRIQMENGMYFVNEHPSKSNNKEDGCLSDTEQDERVYKIKRNMSNTIFYLKRSIN